MHTIQSSEHAKASEANPAVPLLPLQSATTAPVPSPVPPYIVSTSPRIIPPPRRSTQTGGTSEKTGINRCCIFIVRSCLCSVSVVVTLPTCHSARNYVSCCIRTVFVRLRESILRAFTARGSQSHSCGIPDIQGVHVHFVSSASRFPITRSSDHTSQWCSIRVLNRVLHDLLLSR